MNIVRVDGNNLKGRVELDEKEEKWENSWIDICRKLRGYGSDISTGFISLPVLVGSRFISVFLNKNNT